MAKTRTDFPPGLTPKTVEDIIEYAETHYFHFIHLTMKYKGAEEQFGSHNVAYYWGTFEEYPLEESYKTQLSMHLREINSFKRSPVDTAPDNLNRRLIPASNQGQQPSSSKTTTEYFIPEETCHQEIGHQDVRLVVQTWYQSLKSRSERGTATAITYVDVYTVKYTLISHAQKYGFEQGVIACCGHGGKYNFNNTARCGATQRVNGTEIVVAKSCKDPSVRIIWDGIHYTEAANNFIFQQILNGSFSDPPTSLQTACFW
ncbi:GDSL esterase/lipase, partial [Mucuna pruriens]